MVRHIVMWKLKPFAAGADKQENARRMKQRLESLAGVVPGARRMEVGINFNPKGYDAVLVSEFDDEAALDAYQVHPAHMKVKEFVHEVMEDRAAADCRI